MADLNVLIELINSAGVLGLLLFLLFCLIKGWLITKSQAEDIKATAKQSAETTARIVIANYGAGNMYGEASVDGGTTYGDQMLILSGTAFETTNMAPTHIRFTHIADTSYQLYIEGT